MITPKIALLALTLCATCLSPLSAQPIREHSITRIASDQIPGDFSAALAEVATAREMFLGGDIAAALDILQPMAEAGNAYAQNMLGIALTDANSTIGRYDPEAGVEYLLAASTQNFGPAMLNLASTYQETHADFAPDPAQSARWFIAAAELGYAPAYLDAADALVWGRGVPADIAAGRAWIELALAGEDRPLALSYLGDLAYYGLGQEVDLAQSLELYLQAATLGEAYSAQRAAEQLLYGWGTPVDEDRAVSLLEQAIAGGEAEAYGDLAYLLYLGTDTLEPDDDRALALAMQGDALGSGYSSAVLGDFLRFGIGAEIDYDLARAALERGVARGSSRSLYSLGDMAYFGQGEPQSYERALSYFLDAIELSPDLDDALYSVAYMQMRGEGTEIDIASAVALLEQSIARRHHLSMIEGIEAFGSPEHAGPHSDPVRAFSHCLYLGEEIRDQSANTGTIANHEVTCARLQGELSANDKARAAEMAAALQLTPAR